MQQIQFTILNDESVVSITPDEVLQIQEIIKQLVCKGGLTRLRGGCASIHFDDQGLFQKIQLNYYPWKRKSEGA